MGWQRSSELRVLDEQKSVVSPVLVLQPLTMVQN
jgi:hypothetical protein